ncbi:MULTISPECIES: MlaC/ttg2D family ABC transporter substrate-binding protein [Acetobacter]|jgi:phospholipid transport system substrate-binding protein|uniref:Phospholipid transport system substrate-binding protein n=1 Tax=Acetobacter lovaniensis TaxID=104100 RepID=A0A841QG14_9PROT|nr:ABC transporter substrate-binding protein [Acetobacter lovaniensis]MBB6457305.1 phospholipid transport system substrate-binding protein [Acetobacter lovaniensis]MCI1698430.1 ABC transporter substrate-binding protein [Acetobacter lovaniensis]MCI1795559.1 ABC transporter substrate-binding protein [Acetobacter lovaniensis]MCP1239695.1 ABC transporter substrate-binding protein [Acetobacter lovaniensis]NHN81641.1 ABC transporter substrate-binding protein [Acetobacter lovaniensis]
MRLLSGRRIVLATLALTCASGLFALPARAADNAKQFIQSFGTQLVAIVNSPVPLSEKKIKVLPLVQKNVDIDGIGRYCLGRYWKIATPEQKQRYQALFHEVLVNAITDKLGEYRGVSFTIGDVTRSGNEDSVNAILTRPQQPPASMQWIVGYENGQPQVVDVIGEGASLRLTQRNDYSSFIARNGDSVAALLSALQKQLDRHNQSTN